MKKIMLIIYFVFFIIICGCGKTENKEIEKEVFENSEIQETSKEENKIDEQQEEINKPIINNSSENKIEKEDITIPSIVGTWIYNNEEYVYIFETAKLVEIKTKTNTIREYNYIVDENKVIIDGKSVKQYEIKENKLYLGNIVLTKAPIDYVYPSVYTNLDIFYGTWKLETQNNVIKLEDGYEKELENTLIMNKTNMSGYGSCGGSGCYSYIYNFLNNKPQLYFGSLCYELIDNDTLIQIKCPNDNIIGYTGWEDQTIHNIIYKRVG